MPKYAVGDTVTVNAGLASEYTARIVDMSTYRSKAQPGQTYYRFDFDSESRRGAWEWNVQPTTAMVTPEQAAARVISNFDTVLVSARMFATRTELVVTVSIERGDEYHSIDYRAQVYAGRMVELIGQWRTSVDGNYWQDHDNIGAALVETHNATLPSADMEGV